jgi:Stage II sporulation protein E (SpoIIE)
MSFPTPENSGSRTSARRKRDETADPMWLQAEVRHSLFRGIAARLDAEALFAAPERAIGLVNAALARDNATCMFVTLFLAASNTTTGRLAYVRAGHIHHSCAEPTD